jgi:antitoxin component of RelBE/YafQ-DinJ toxin-antitoxin module
MKALTTKNSKQPSIHVRLSNHDKQDFETLCSDLGMTVTGAVQLYVKAMLRTRSVPFSIQDGYENYKFEHLPTDTQEAIVDGRKHISGETSPEYSFKSSAEAIAFLNEDD